MKNIFQPPFWKKLRKLQIRPSAVGIASNFGHRSRSRRSKIFGYGRRTSAFGPTLQLQYGIFIPEGTFISGSRVHTKSKLFLAYKTENSKIVVFSLIKAE